MVPPALLPSGPFLRHRLDLQSLPLAAPEASRLVAPAASGEARLVAETWNAFGGLLGALSAELGIEPGLTTAVLCVESGGKGFGSDGRLFIRFECHVFWERWARQTPANDDAFRAHFQFDPQRRWEGHQFRSDASQAWQGVHRNQETEWQALELARGLADAPALCSTSMGSPQIMGYHHARIGYATVQEMFAAFGESTTGMRAQILALLDFLRGTGGSSTLIDALRRKDILAFARAYNGPGQAAVYGQRIARMAQLFDECQRSHAAKA